MENPLFNICSMAMLNNQMVYQRVFLGSSVPNTKRLQGIPSFQAAPKLCATSLGSLRADPMGSMRGTKNWTPKSANLDILLIYIYILILV